jgi:NADH-quinone oxidoreductase subunit L
VATLWLVPALPLAGFAVLIFFGKRLGRAAAWVAVGLMGLDAALAVFLLTRAVAGAAVPGESLMWWAAGTPVSFGLALDPLSALMIVVVTLVSLLVYLYSIGYMAGDERYGRYFAYLSLFSASMLTLLLADGFALLYAAWELVGLSSYLLIGFWFERRAAADAAKKAFVVTRVGDVGLLVGVLLLGSAAGSYRFASVFAALKAGALVPGLVTAAALLLFAGAVGKSAQFPLFTWLPDAMEGPTPVSALIHAATMVAAGVYLVARAFPLFAASPAALAVVAAVGGLTALGAAVAALAQSDLKRVLAYSTISQLGLMFLGLGAGQRDAAVFHLMNHAAFKALLFLAAGAVIHAAHEQDIRKLGGLARRMPLVATTFIIGAAALAGVPPLSGFWSKDEMLGGALASGHPVLFAVGLATSLLTAVYAFRLVFTLFLDERLGEEDAGVQVEGGPPPADLDHPAPAVMAIPLVVLAALATVLGLAGGPALGFPLERFISLGVAGGVAAAAPALDPVTALVAGAVAALGIGLAWLGWGRSRLAGDRWLARARGPYEWARSGFGVDELYKHALVAGALAVAGAVAFFDDAAIDGAVRGVAKAASGAGGLANAWQSGKVSRYFIAMLAGVVLIASVIASLAVFAR